MDLTFKLELPSDPSTLNALTKYRALIDYLISTVTDLFVFKLIIEEFTRSRI